MTGRGDDPRTLSFADTALGRAALWAATALAFGYLLLGTYTPAALTALVALFFAAYVWLRVMLYLENARFSPKRYRVGITWALIGIDSDTDEFDPRPARVYFLLLAMLFGGLLVRPVLRWMIG